MFFLSVTVQVCSQVFVINLIFDSYFLYKNQKPLSTSVSHTPGRHLQTQKNIPVSDESQMICRTSLLQDLFRSTTAAKNKYQNIRTSSFITTDGPDECGLHGSGRLVDVVAVETEPRLQSQTVSGSETSQFHLAVSQELVRHLHHSGLRDRDLGHRDTDQRGVDDNGPKTWELQRDMQ